MAVTESDDQKEILENLLECPVCFEISQPPIYACVIGHLICKECVRKVELCPICRREYTGTRNFTAEALCANLRAKNSDNCRKPQMKSRPKAEAPNPHKLEQLPCFKNATNTSSDEELCTLMSLYEDPNEFGPIRCVLFTDECRNSTVDFFSYLDHLRNKHNVFSSEVGCSIHKKRQNTRGNQFVKNGSSKLFIMNCFDRQFLISMHQDNHFVWIWVALHGSEEETNDFNTRISIEHNDHEDIIWTGKVKGIRKTYNQISNSAETMNIPINDVRKRLVKFAWLVQVQIFRSLPAPTTSSSSISFHRGGIRESSRTQRVQRQQSFALPSSSSAVQSQYFYSSTQAPQRPPLPRSLSFNHNQIRAPSTKSAPPPLPPYPPIATRGLANPQPFQSQNNADGIRIRTPIAVRRAPDPPATVRRLPEIRPRSSVYPQQSQPNLATTSAGYRPLTWEYSTPGVTGYSTSLGSSSRSNSYSCSSPSERQRKSCIML